MNRAFGIVVMVCMLLTSCTREVETGPAGEFWTTAAGRQGQVWPAAPSPPRIRYLQSIRSAEDLGFEAPAMERLFGLVVGKEDIGMTRPYGLAVMGRLLVIADPGAAAIHFLDLKGEFSKKITTLGTTDLLSPVGIAVGGDHLYVSDSAQGKVFVLDSKGQLIRELDGLLRPTGLAFDPATQRLYVAETLAHRIGVFDADGARLFDIANVVEGDGAFNAPTHLAFRDGVLLINDTMNFRVVATDPDGQFLWTFGIHGTGSGHIAQAKGIDIDSRGHIYVADAIFNRVQIFDQQGQFLLAFSGPGQGESQMRLPAGIFVVEDKIFVSDSQNKRVLVFEYVGGSTE